MHKKQRPDIQTYLDLPYLHWRPRQPYRDLGNHVLGDVQLQFRVPPLHVLQLLVGILEKVQVVFLPSHKPKKSVSRGLLNLSAETLSDVLLCRGWFKYWPAIESWFPGMRSPMTEIIFQIIVPSQTNLQQASVMVNSTELSKGTYISGRQAATGTRELHSLSEDQP